MRGDLGPPKKVPRLGTRLPTGDTTTGVPTPLTKKNQATASDSKLRGRRGGCEPSRQCCRRNTVGRYALGFKDGFLRGRVDALRKVDDLDALAVLARLVDEYELAAGDR